MNVQSIYPNSAAPVSSLTGGDKVFGKVAGGEDFGSFVKDAVSSLDRTQKSAEKEIARAVAGESPDLHKTVIALQTADLNFQFGLQVRNKLMGAYEEIMRMQV